MDLNQPKKRRRTRASAQLSLEEFLNVFLAEFLLSSFADPKTGYAESWMGGFTFKRYATAMRVTTGSRNGSRFALEVAATLAVGFRRGIGCGYFGAISRLPSRTYPGEANLTQWYASSCYFAG
jgi:hypothetical protein